MTIKTDKEALRNRNVKVTSSEVEIENYLFTEGRKFEDYFLEIWSFGTGISFNAHGRTYDLIIEDDVFRMSCIDYLNEKGVVVVEKGN